MNDSDEAPEARKRTRRRRRSLRVPVDEVPRPTQSPQDGALASEEVELEEGGATMEIPAFTDEGRATLEEVSENATVDDDLFGVPNESGTDDPLDEAPTVVREAPSDREDGSEPEEAAAAASGNGSPREETSPPSPRPVGAGPSVEVDLDAELADSEGSDEDDEPESREADAGGFDAGPTAADDQPDGADAAADPAAAADDADGLGDAGEPERDGSDGAAEVAASDEPEPDDAPEHEPAVVPLVGVIVQRVVSVASASTSAPPEPEDDDDDVISSFDTVPGGAFAVDVEEMEEPEISFDAEEAHYGADLEELDVDLDDGEEAAEAAPPSDGPEAAELTEQEAEALLEEETETEEGGAKKKPSKPPPPPSNQKSAAPSKGNAPPPPPAGEAEAKAAAPPKQPRRKKARKKWWEELFNDDYLRTVPIPHPKTIIRQCDFIEQRFGLAQGATILDVGCGLGLHAVELTRRGYLVVGLDLSLPMLSRAADEAQEHGYKINFLHADMRQMNFDGAFDAVMCWGTTFGYFDDETNKQVVERLYRALKPRGLLLLDVVNRDYVIRGQPNLVWFEGDGCVVMEETQMNYITSRLEVKRNVILDDGRQRDTLYTMRLYSLHELGQLLHLQGFRVVEVTGREAHPGVFFGADSPQLLIMAERRPQGPPAPQGSSAQGSSAQGASTNGRSGSAEMAATTPSDTPSEPAPGPDSAEAESTQAEPAQSESTNSEATKSEPSDDVNEALAQTLESSEELDLGEELDPDELEAEDLDEEDLEAAAASKKSKDDDESE